MQVSLLIGSLLALPAISAHPTHLTKRIAQVIADSTQDWVQACETAGGGSQCNPISVTAFSTLLAAAGPCDQQNAADQMIDLAKSLGSNAKMIQLAQVFAQQPRNSPNSLSVPYCQQAPKNEELNGLFQCQFDGVNPNTFVGNLQVGAPGTIPFGLSSPVSPPKSCPANPQGGVADGTQLVDSTQNPSTGPTDTSGAPPSPTPSSVSSGTSASGDDSNDTPTSTVQMASSPSSTATSGGFQQQNKLDAQKLNQQFTSLTLDSSCTEGQNACVQGQFAECVGGKFVLTSCGSSLTCVALPLVNSPGTSITCDTQADAEARIGGSITGA